MRPHVTGLEAGDRMDDEERGPPGRRPFAHLEPGGRRPEPPAAARPGQVPAQPAQAVRGEEQDGESGG